MNLEYIWGLFTSLMFSFLGGVASYLKCAKKFELFVFVQKCFLAVFTGLVIHFILTYCEVAPILISASVSLSGYIGIAVLDFLWEAIREKISKMNIIKEDIK